MSPEIQPVHACAHAVHLQLREQLDKAQRVLEFSKAELQRMAQHATYLKAKLAEETGPSRAAWVKTVPSGLIDCDEWGPSSDCDSCPSAETVLYTWI